MAATAQQFCVKWNSYSTNLQSVFPRLLTSEHFVDVTLACEGQMIKCHKVVLSACSTYFERLLVSNPCPHPIIFMKDMKHFEVQALVDFMYRGEVNVSQDELNSLLVAAEALQIRGLCGSDNAFNGGGGGVKMRGAGPQPQPPSPPPFPPHTRGGGESPHHVASKRRRSDGDARPPRIVSVTSNGEEAGPTTFRNTHSATLGDREATGDDEQPQEHNFKQESPDGDVTYSNEPDGDVLDEEFDRLEQQEDSDGLKEESSRTGQAGPSGLSQPVSRSDANTPDKTATGMMVNMKQPKREGIKWPIPISRKVRRMFEVRETGSTPKVEISRDSGVCVSEDVWRRLSFVSSPTQVVRRLLLALFSAETLMRSNLRGGKCKNKRLDTGGRRDKLDERVTDAIYDATVQRFPGFTKGAFGVAVNSKIAELRFHNNKK